MDDNLGIRHKFFEETFVEIVFSVRTVHHEIPATAWNKLKHFECV